MYGTFNENTKNTLLLLDLLWKVDANQRFFCMCTFVNIHNFFGRNLSITPIDSFDNSIKNDYNRKTNTLRHLFSQWIMLLLSQKIYKNTCTIMETNS